MSSRRALLQNGALSMLVIALPANARSALAPSTRYSTQDWRVMHSTTGEQQVVLPIARTEQGTHTQYRTLRAGLRREHRHRWIAATL